MFDSRFGELAAARAAELPWHDRPDFRATVGLGDRDLGDRDGDIDTSTQITLIDPHRLWAPGVQKLLAEPAQRPRRDGEPLKVCHSHGNGDGAADLALAAGSRLTAVIVGPLAPASVDALLASLCQAARRPGWRCTHLLMLLPHGAVWMANKVDAVHWPAGLRVHCNDAVLSSAAAAWQVVLAHWDAWLAAPVPAATRLRDCLAELLQVDGLLACAVVDAASGAILARETREDSPFDLELAAAASSEALRAHRLAARALGLPAAAVDEVMASAGPRLLLLRSSAANPGRFVFALLDQPRGDLATARARLIDAEARLAR